MQESQTAWSQWDFFTKRHTGGPEENNCKAMGQMSDWTGQKISSNRTLPI